MRLKNLYEDEMKFKSIEDVRKAGTEDLANVNKAIEDITKAMEDTLKKVTGGRKELDGLRDDYEQALDSGDVTAAEMVKKHHDLKSNQIQKAEDQYKIHEKYLSELERKQKQLMGILSSEQNLEKIYNKINHPGDLSKQSPADMMLNNLRNAQTQPDTASPSDIRGIGRQL